MNRIIAKKWLPRKCHYKNKLKYELTYSGYIVDLLEQRKYNRKTKTLFHKRRINENSLYVNPLGVKTSLMPF
ncbi:hypothetical protein BANORC5_10090 [Bacteroides nordii]|nr:hypothetical protein BANORC5_10090 [Bacteroides nordii]